MTDFERRLRDELEPVLAIPEPRERISAYHDMPYAIFRYDPEQEFALRASVARLRTRLENTTCLRLVHQLPSDRMMWRPWCRPRMEA
jgi:hypothetical protein